MPWPTKKCRKIGNIDFIEKFEAQMKAFEEKLKEEILLFLDRNKGEGTSHEIMDFLRQKSGVFNRLYEKNYNKAWYRVRKILLKLNLSRMLSVSETSKIKFLNYKWSKSGQPKS